MHMSGRTMSTAASPLACTICSKTFSKLEHLQRHTTASHSTARPFVCGSCGQGFARRDVLVRHLASCKLRPVLKDGSLVPQTVPKARRGRKRSSCDACVRAKRACNGMQPCLHCVHRKQRCHFTDSRTDSRTETTKQCQGQALDPENDGSRPLNAFVARCDHDALATSFARRQSSPLLDLAVANEMTMTSIPNSNDRPYNSLGSPSIMYSSASHLAFLANLTSTQGMADTFDCGTVDQRMAIMQHQLSPPDRGTVPRLDTSDVACKARGIVENLEKLSKLRYGLFQEESSSDTESTYRDFFHPVNMEKSLFSYFAFWQPNCPIVHEATFDIRQAPETLIAAMALIGACVSPISGQRESARLCLDAVEHLVFSDPAFSDRPIAAHTSLADDVTIHHRLDALRAAYCMVLLQSWEGTEEGKRRARRSRYTEIIGVFRSTCGSDLSHGDISPYLDDTPTLVNWRRFARTEELIRTSTYIFLLDSAYAMFNNTPPRLAFQEARMALSCPETCFQASTIEDWTSAMRLWSASGLGARQITLTRATSILYLEHVSECDWMLLQEMSCLNMFAVIHRIAGPFPAARMPMLTVVLVLHVQLFHMRCHPMPGSQTPLQRRALDNWNQAWQRRTIWQSLLEMPESAHKQGFYRHAPEFWSLADHILASSEGADLSSFDQTTSINESLIAQLLSKYDESDMSQVHDLVNLFDSLSLEL